MLQHVPTAYEVCFAGNIAFRIDVLDECDPFLPGISVWFVRVTWVKSNSVVIAQFAEEAQEIALPAAYLYDVLIAQTIALNQPHSGMLSVTAETGRKVQRIFIDFTVF
jgi:hypothetical protein